MPKHGVPAVLLSDNGPQFVAAVLADFCANVGIRKIFSMPYYPQGNPVVDSYMRTLKKGLAALVGEDRRDWALFLPAVALSHNTTPHIARDSLPSSCLMAAKPCCPCSGIQMSLNWTPPPNNGSSDYGGLEFWSTRRRCDLRKSAEKFSKVLQQEYP